MVEAARCVYFALDALAGIMPPCSRINQTSLNTAEHFKVILNILQVKTSLSNENPIQYADEKNRNMPPALLNLQMEIILGVTKIV